MNTPSHLARILGMATCATALLLTTTALAQKTYRAADPNPSTSDLGFAAPGGRTGGGRDIGPIFGAPGKACRLMEMKGELDTFIGGGSIVWYSKSFQLFGEKAAEGQTPAQFLISVGADVSGGFSFNYPQGIPGEPSIMVYQSGETGAAVYLPTNGSMTVSGTPGEGEASFIFHNLQLSVVDNASLVPIKDGDCINFYDFSFAGGVVSVPPDWTCAPELYSDDICHCGCGALDEACAANAVDVCDVCDANGACAEDESDCSTIDPDDITQCYVPPVPLYYDGANGIGALLENRCASCHNDSFQIELSYSALLWGISAAGEGYEENDGFSHYVVPGDPSASALYAGWVEPGLMPTFGGGLPAADRERIREWIEQGALQAP